MTSSIEVTVYGGRYKALEAPLKKCLQLALSRLKKKKVWVEVFLLRSTEMRILNRTFRGINKDTEVLSFPAENFPSPYRGFTYLGEIYLDPSYIRKEKGDIFYLAIHGLLHLLGYTHKSSHDSMKMEKKEKQIYAQSYYRS